MGRLRCDNFEVGDLVVVVLPGAVLPGGFAISARKTYGHVSNGMICSSTELGLGDDGTHGIVVLEPGEATSGDDAIELLVAARRRPRHRRHAGPRLLPVDPWCRSRGGHGVRGSAEGPGGADADRLGLRVVTRCGSTTPTRVASFVTRTVTGIDAKALSPRWLQQRLVAAGMRPISIGVDVTNYVMLELGQPIHGYDKNRLSGEIVVRRATSGEKLVTLDDQTRELDAEDLLITDDSGPIGIAGVMGGASTEISESTTDVVIEAAHFDPIVIARSSRRHKLSSEASRRFEREVDPNLPRYAAQRVADLLAELAGGTILPDETVVDTHPQPSPVIIRADHAARVAGAPITIEETHPSPEVGRLHDRAGRGRRRTGEAGGGCARPRSWRGRRPADLPVVDRLPRRAGDDLLAVTPPSWRPDLRDPNDFAEEAIRLFGYDNVPSVSAAGAGWSGADRSRSGVGAGSRPRWSAPG